MLVVYLFQGNVFINMLLSVLQGDNTVCQLYAHFVALPISGHDNIIIRFRCRFNMNTNHFIKWLYMYELIHLTTCWHTRPPKTIDFLIFKYNWISIPFRTSNKSTRKVLDTNKDIQKESKCNDVLLGPYFVPLYMLILSLVTANHFIIRKNVFHEVTAPWPLPL